MTIDEFNKFGWGIKPLDHVLAVYRFDKNSMTGEKYKADFRCPYCKHYIAYCFGNDNTIYTCPICRNKLKENDFEEVNRNDW